MATDMKYPNQVNMATVVQLNPSVELVVSRTAKAVVAGSLSTWLLPFT